MFNYRQIGRGLIEELAELVGKGQSVALFAPRFGGKRHVMDRVREAIARAGHFPIIHLRLLDEKPVVTAQVLSEQLMQALRRSGIEAPDSATDPFSTIEDFARQKGKRVILFAANIDAIAHGLTRRLLQRFRKLVQSDSLVVMLSGESDFLGLVYGPNSDFNCENYFLQGYTEEEFGAFLGQYVHTLGIRLDSPEEIVRHFWRRTGGNSYLVRPLLLEVLENMAHDGEVLSARPLGLKDFGSMPRAKAIPGTYSTQLCRHATRMMAWDPNYWGDLEKLIKERGVKVESLKPTQLEWAGIAVRRDDHLVFASEMMENFANLHYDDLHFGDLYARNGHWDQALERYARLSPEEKRRPLSVDDRTETEKTINAFGRELFSEAAKGVDEVRRLFARGCEHLLGFSEVTFWRYEGEWKFRPPVGGQPQSSAPKDLKVFSDEMLPAPETAVDDLFTVPAPWGEFAVAAKVQSARSDYIRAVIVSELENRIVISSERRRLLEMLLRQFIEAHTHAVNVAKTRRRLEIRNRQMELLNSIFKAMGSQVTDADGVLRRAAGGLLEIGYSRVLFCLVDPKAERIQGVFDYSDDWPRVDVAKKTDYSLDDIYKDIQPYVIATRKPFTTPDARKAELTNKAVVEQAGMTALAIVPILNHVGEAIGTIHVERKDKLQPSAEEVEDLTMFGRLLATAIEQAERVKLLQTTLDKIPEPVAIINARKHFRYANKAASDLLGISNRWHDRGENGMALAGIPPQIRQVAEEALQGRRIFRHIGKKGEQEGYSRAVLSQGITDWRGEKVGAFLHLQELTDFTRVFRAFLTVASKRDADEALYAMLDAAQMLGYTQGRLYVIDEFGELVSRRSYGMVDQETATAFEHGIIQIPRDPAHHQSWVSIERKEPIVFRYEPEGRDGDLGRTAQGLEYRVATEHYHRDLLKKRPGDFWVDVPLLTKDRPLGKVILPCDEYLRPEKFDMLRDLLDADTGLLDDLVRREREQYERDLELRAMDAEKFMADVAHNLATRFGSFPGYLNLYRRYERRLPELKELNDDFAHALEQAQTIVKRAKERLAPVINLKRERHNLSGYLTRVVKSLLPENVCEITSEIESVEVEIDGHLIGAAISELIENSKAVHQQPDQLKVEVHIRRAPGPDDQLQIVYRDNGPGIPEEARARLFEDFFSHRPQNPRGSTGLGMGFINRVIKAHGGQITLGAPGRGAEFIITLPSRTLNDCSEAAELMEKANVSHSHR